MSTSHARMVGDAAPGFLDKFFDLNKYTSVPNLLGETFLIPMNRAMWNGINDRPGLVRLGAPLAGVSFGVLSVALGIAVFVERIFKGLANLVLSVCSFDIKRSAAAISNMGIGVYALAFLPLKGIVSATLGTVGLLIAPRWTYENVIMF